MAVRPKVSNGHPKTLPEGNAASNGQDFFRSCFSHAAIGFSITDPSGRFLDVNPAYCTIMGYTKAELCELDVLAITHPDDLAKSTANLEALIAGRIPACVMEKRKIKKSGEVVCVENSVSLIRDADGQPRYLVQLTQDISDRQRMHRALEESEHTFKAFMNNLPALAWIKDADGKYLYMNEPLQGALPAHRTDWQGRGDEDLWSAELAAEYRRNDLQVLSEGRLLQTIENWWYDGEFRSLFVSKFPILVDGELPLVGGTAIDITELKRAEDGRDKAEQRFRDIFENTREGIFQSTPEGKYIVANPALARMYGYESPEALIESCKDISEQIYEDPERREAFKRLMETEGAVREFEIKMLRKDGTGRWSEVNARAVRDPQGAVLYYEGTSQDITERKRAQEKSTAFATLARKLSGARTQLDAATIIAETAKNLFAWDSCNLDLYDARLDLVVPLLNIDTIDGKQVDVTPLIASGPPTARGRRVIAQGPVLQLRPEPAQFDSDAIPFGDMGRPSASLMTVPIQHGSDVVGLLSIQSYTHRAYNEVTLTDFASLADHCGEAINRIRAEQSLHESEERFRQLAEHLEDVIWMSDGDFTNVLYINRAYERVFGRSRQGLYESLTSFLMAAHPDDREMVEQMIERQRHGEYVPIEYRIVRPDGSIRWILRRAFPIRDHQGEIYRVAGVGQDITERKEAEEALRESEERYRDLVENSRELICTHDLNGLVLSANPTAAAALGYEPDEYVGKKTIRDILLPEVRHQFEEYMARLRKEGATSGIMLVKTKSGETRMWEYYNSLRTEGVTAPVVRGMARDITEELRARKALRQSEERYRELFENSRDAVYLHDMDGRYLSVNRAAEELIGYSRDEILGRDFTGFVAPRNVRSVRRNFCKKLETKGATIYEVEVIAKGGRRVPVEVSSRIIHNDGEPVGVQGTVRNISERKRNQEMLRAYSRRLVDAQESERKKIARELHDEIGQILTAVRLGLHAVKRTSESSASLSRIDETVVIVDEALERVRELSLEIRPAMLDDLGLVAALRWYLNRFCERAGIGGRVHADFADESRLPHKLEIACFRIVQEALTNVARHADASVVDIDMKRSNRELRLSVVDDGKGFDVDKLLASFSSKSFGLHGMEERALDVGGEIEIRSSPGEGTELCATFPLRQRTKPRRKTV